MENTLRWTLNAGHPEAVVVERSDCPPKYRFEPKCSSEVQAKC